MSQTTYPATRSTRLRERPARTADKYNPFSSAAIAETGPERHRPPAAPSLEDQHQALLELRARVQGRFAHTADAALSDSVETTAASPDTADCASESVGQDLALSLMGSAADTLSQIEAALERIDEGSYGRCAECGTRIPAARLEAIPYATCCVECAARQERAA